MILDMSCFYQFPLAKSLNKCIERCAYIRLYMDLLIVPTASIGRCALRPHRFHLVQAGLPYYEVYVSFIKIVNYGTAH